jgi:ABC-2 type transport system permease protein
MPDGTVSRVKLPSLWLVLGTQLRYQLLLLTRTPRALVAGLILPAVLLSAEMGHVRAPGSTPVTPAWLAVRIAGIIIFGTAAIAFMTHSNALVVAREDGVLRRWRASPLPTWAYFAGKIFTTLLIADLAGALLVFVGVKQAHLHVGSHAIIGLLAVATLGALALAAIGTAITPLITGKDAANPVLMVIYLPLVVVSGAFGTVLGLPSWLNTWMTYLPAQPVIDGCSRVLEHSSGSIMSVHDLAVLAGWSVGGLLLSLLFFQWDPHRPSRARRGGRKSASRTAKAASAAAEPTTAVTAQAVQATADTEAETAETAEATSDAVPATSDA